MTRLLASFATIAVMCAAPASAQDDAGDRLSQTIDTALEADGPWLLPQERALIARKCGYATDSDDNQSINMSDGVLICANGRRVDDPEVRAMAEVASERISRRVHAIMDSPAVRNAIAAVSDEAVRAAMASLREISPQRNRR